MIDTWHETFFHVCRIGSYTKTADHLHITQPNVSQHIRRLEKQYGGKLFEYRDRRLTLTLRGKKLYTFLQTLHADISRVTNEVLDMDAQPAPVVFGATLTIGEYVMPWVIDKLLKDDPLCSVSMMVANTKTLLRKLEEGEIEFALLEGYFDISWYNAHHLSDEAFVPVCSPHSALAHNMVSFEKLTEQRLILRETGSGTREILEQALKEHNYTLASFSRILEIGNMSAIKQLVEQNHGITFMYRQAAKKELESGTLATFGIEGFSVSHKFSFVFLKNSVYESHYLDWHKKILRMIKQADSSHAAFTQQ